MRNLPNNSPGGREQGRGGTQRAQVARSETSLLSQPQVHEPDETPDPERRSRFERQAAQDCSEGNLVSTFISEDGEWADVGLGGGWLRPVVD